MKLELYQIDAFTEEIFQGNPACAVPLKNWLPVKDGFYYMDFPSRMPEASTLPDTITKSLNIQPKEIFNQETTFWYMIPRRH